MSEKAGKEYQIEQALEKMSSEWENVTLVIDAWVKGWGGGGGGALTLNNLRAGIPPVDMYWRVCSI